MVCIQSVLSILYVNWASFQGWRRVWIFYSALFRLRVLWGQRRYHVSDRRELFYWCLFYLPSFSEMFALQTVVLNSSTNLIMSPFSPLFPRGIGLLFVDAEAGSSHSFNEFNELLGRYTICFPLPEDGMAFPCDLMDLAFSLFCFCDVATHPCVSGVADSCVVFTAWVCIFYTHSLFTFIPACAFDVVLQGFLLYIVHALQNSAACFVTLRLQGRLFSFLPICYPYSTFFSFSAFVLYG